MVIMWRVYVHVGSCRQGHYRLIVKVICNWMDIVYLVLLVLNNKMGVSDV